MNKLIIAMCGVVLIAVSSCKSRPESPYYISKSEATNKYEKKVVKTYNKLVENCTNVMNEPQNNLSNTDIYKYGKNLKSFAESTKQAAEKRAVSIDLAKKVGVNTIGLGKDLLLKFKDILPTSYDMMKIAEELLK